MECEKIIAQWKKKKRVLSQTQSEFDSEPSSPLIPNPPKSKFDTGFGALCSAFTALCTYSLFWFDRVMDKTRKVLPRNGCAGMYIYILEEMF